MRPHIVFTAHQVHRRSNGGMESATRLFEALRGDFRWTLITDRETERTERWRAGGAEVVALRADEVASSLRKAWHSAALAAATARRAGGQRPTIVHANDIQTARAVVWVSRLLGAPFVFTLRDTKPPGEPYGAHWRRTTQRVSALVTLSRDMRNTAAERLQVPADRVAVIPSVVDLDRFRPVSAEERAAIRARLGIGACEVAVGMVAGVFEKKGQLGVLREVLPAVQSPEVKLHLIGDVDTERDAYGRSCADAAEAVGDRVAFHGFRSDVADWLRALDIVVLNSAREGLARCMIEAMACGTPVVSVDVSSAREMLEETGAGIVVPHGDAAAMTAAIASLVSDPARRAALGRAGRAAAERRFDAGEIAARWRELYHRLTECPTGRTAS